MGELDETCWDTVKGAAAGGAAERRAFASTYLPIVRAYLGARWRGTGYIGQLEDAVQDVFVDCFRERGALERADPERGARFRSFLFAVVRNVALRHEEKRARRKEQQHETGFGDRVAADDEALSRVFDRAWAQTIMRRAMQRQADAAAAKGPEALRRVELLRLRFQEGLPIRDIAERWDVDAAVLHRQFRTARAEFQAALVTEVRFHNAGTDAEVHRECASLLELLA
jgi:RNA polymerase sigma factor (sigma-70 family)